MRRRIVAVGLFVLCSVAQAFDPLGSERDLGAVPPLGQVPLDAELVGGSACPPPFAGGLIPLSEVVKRALCRDPRTRSAWADASLAAARLGVARAAYLPTVTGSLSAAVSGRPSGRVEARSATMARAVSGSSTWPGTCLISASARPTWTAPGRPCWRRLPATT